METSNQAQRYDAEQPLTCSRTKTNFRPLNVNEGWKSASMRTVVFVDLYDLPRRQLLIESFVLCEHEKTRLRNLIRCFTSFRWRFHLPHWREFRSEKKTFGQTDMPSWSILTLVFKSYRYSDEQIFTQKRPVFSRSNQVSSDWKATNA